MTVMRRSTSRRANSRVVDPLEIRIVSPSWTRAAAASAMARFAARPGSPALGSGGPPRAAPPYVRRMRPSRASRARSRRIVEGVTPRSRRACRPTPGRRSRSGSRSGITRDVRDMRETVGAHSASCQDRDAHSTGRFCAYRAGILRDRDFARLYCRRSVATWETHGAAARHSTRSRGDLVRARDVHGPRPRPPAEPAQGAPSRGSGVDHARGDGRLQADGRPRARRRGHGHAPRSGGRGRPVHRGRLAVGSRWPARRPGGDRLRGSGRRPGSAACCRVGMPRRRSAWGRRPRSS